MGFYYFDFRCFLLKLQRACAFKCRLQTPNNRLNGYALDQLPSKGMTSGSVL